MRGVWIFDKRPEKLPYFADLSRFVKVLDAIEYTEERQEEEANVIAYVPGQSTKDLSHLSIQEFTSKQGCLVINDRHKLGERHPLLRLAERLMLYHQYALHLAEESGLKGASIGRLMGSKTYKKTIEETTGMSRNTFVRLRKMVQDSRGGLVHPTEVVTCCDPPPISLKYLATIISEEVKSEVYSLYSKPLPEDSPVLKFARSLNRKRAGTPKLRNK